MNTLAKFELMEKIERELTDLKNSQTAVLQKIAKIEIDNMELGNKTLDAKLPSMHQNAADVIDTINNIFESFEETKDKFEDKNNITALKEQEAIDSVKNG